MPIDLSSRGQTTSNHPQCQDSGRRADSRITGAVCTPWPSVWFWVDLQPAEFRRARPVYGMEE